MMIVKLGRTIKTIIKQRVIIQFSAYQLYRLYLNLKNKTFTELMYQ